MSTGMLGSEAIQERQGGVWEYISPSRLNCWLACPLKFKLRYLDGVKTPTTPSLFLGIRVHAALECAYRRRQLGLAWGATDVTGQIAESWDQSVEEAHIQFDTPAEERALRKQAADLVTAYLAYVPPDEPQPLAIETALDAPLVDPATGEDLGIPLLGVIDLVLGNPAGPSIVDFKTSARRPDPLEIAHEIQLSSYSYLFRDCAQQRESGLEIRLLIKTKVPKIEFHRCAVRTEGHFRRLFSIIREYLDSLDSGRFNYRPGWGCSMCDYANTSCRQWQH